MFNTKLQWEGFPGVFKSEGDRSDHFSDKSYIQKKKHNVQNFKWRGRNRKRNNVCLATE